MVIYITHCSAKKMDSLMGTGKCVTPDVLYSATPLQRFIRRCKEERVRWAIFSDLYGVWFPQEKKPWYEKSPDSISDGEFDALVIDFDKKLGRDKTIFFYHNPGRFHRLYRKLIKKSRLKGKIRMITHLDEIGGSDK